MFMISRLDLLFYNISFVFLLFISPFVFLFSLQGFSTEESFSSVEALKASTVDVFVKNFLDGSITSGSGFFITENLLVTNYHVVKGSFVQSVVIRTQSMSEDVGSVLVTSPENDLAIIKTSKSHYKPVTLGNSTDVNRGEGVFFIGSSNGNFGTVSEGVVASKIGGEFLSTTTPSFNGASGSPLFSKNLRTVVGVLLGSNHKSVREGTAFIISVDRLKVLIEENKRVLERATGIRIDPTLYERSLEKGYDFIGDIKTSTDMLFMGRVLLYIEYLVRGYIRENIDQSYNAVRVSDVKSYIYWYKRAAQYGLSEAQYALGLFYHQGIDVEKNSEMGNYWLSRASQQGHLKAFDTLTNKRKSQAESKSNDRETKKRFFCWN